MKKKLSQKKFTVATVKKNINSVTIPSVTCVIEVAPVAAGER